MKSIESQIESIAVEHLGVSSLQTRGNDEDDFHTLTVWQLKAALEAAYQAGLLAQEKAP